MTAAERNGEEIPSVVSRAKGTRATPEGPSGTTCERCGKLASPRAARWRCSSLEQAHAGLK